MSIIEGVRSFILSCPLLGEGKLNVDYLGAEPDEYTIERVPADEILKRYNDGGCLKKFVFAFCSRERVGMAVNKHIGAAKFHEDFSAWIAEKNRLGELPEIGDKRIAQSIRISSSGELEDLADDCAKYRIECTLIYYEA